MDGGAIVSGRAGGNPSQAGHVPTNIFDSGSTETAGRRSDAK